MHQRFGYRQRDAGEAKACDIFGVVGERAQVIGVADGGDGDAVLLRARDDGVQRRHGDDRAQPAFAIDAQEGARGPCLGAGGAGHRGAGMNSLDDPAQAQEAMAGDRPHLRFQEQAGLGAGLVGWHAIGD
jgi:hypothetical protein